MIGFRWAYLGLGLLFAAGFAGAQGTPVTFADDKLEAAVRTALDQPTGTILAEVLAQLTTLTANGAGIASLEGLEQATGLVTLSMATNAIADVRPLAGLRNLQQLNLAANAIVDVSPLENLSALRILSLDDNAIENAEPLAQLTGLQSLSLAGNFLPRFDGVSDLTNLRGLNLAGTRFAGVAQLENLTLLLSLDLSANGPMDLRPLSNLTALRTLALAGNDLENIAPIQALEDLSALDLSNNRITDITPLVNNAGIGLRDSIDLRANLLSQLALCRDIPALEERQATVDFNGLCGGVVPGVTILGPNISRTAGAPVQFAVLFADAAAVPMDSNDLVLQFTGTARAQATISGVGTDQRIVTLSSFSGEGTAAIQVRAGAAVSRDLNGNPESDTSSAAQVVLGDDPVVFADERLEAAVREALRIPSAPLLEADLAQLTALSAERLGIESLVGLEFATALVQLDLSGNAIADLNPLAALGNLRDLDLANNQITDATPLELNFGLGAGDTLDLRFNPLGQNTLCQTVPELARRGADVQAQGLCGGTVPVVEIGPPSEPSTAGIPIRIPLTFRDAAVVPITADHIILETTGTASATIMLLGQGRNGRTVVLDKIRGDGSVRIAVAAGALISRDGNASPAAGPSDPVTVSSEDADGDGLSDTDETERYGTDPQNADSDGDGIDDGREVFFGLDPNDPRDARSDRDGDGLPAVAEVLRFRTDPSNPDTDGDGMPDGFEVMFNLRPLLASDAEADIDGDGLTNREEYRRRTNPRDPLSPRPVFFVAPGGVDLPDRGAMLTPWASLTFAMAELERREIAEATVIAMPGTYAEAFALAPGCTLMGHPSGEVIIEGIGAPVVALAPGSVLRNLEVRESAPVKQPTVLVEADGVTAEIDSVVFRGNATRTATGLAARNGARLIVAGCSFEQLGIGIEVFASPVRARRNVFDNLQTAGVIFRAANGTKQEDAATFGNETDPNTGFNTFGEIDGFAAINETGQEIPMENNDWGIEDPEEAVDRIDGPVDYSPFFPKSAGLIPGTLVCSVWDAKTLEPVGSATVTAGTLEVTDNVEGVYTFAALVPGNYDATASATGYDGLVQGADVKASGITAISFPLEPSSSGQDTDGDGLPDTYETAIGTNPLEPDTDGDGINDNVELAYGTDPLTPDVTPADPNDVNGDNAVDAVDIQLVINKVLGVPAEGVPDVNNDGAVDAVDIQLVVNGVLGM